jgi:Tol biopolymer transport system component
MPSIAAPGIACQNRLHLSTDGLERALDNSETSAGAGSIPGQQRDRLDSWKKIASYLKRDVRTVQRWERREAMPVHRHLHDKQGSVFAFSSELDAWWESRSVRLAEDAGEADRPVPNRSTAGASPTTAPRITAIRWVRLALGAAAVLITAAAAWFAVETDYFWSSPLANAKFTPFLDFTGAEQAAAISRDGKYVAFLADREGQIDAWVSAVGSGTYRNLTHGDVRDLVNPSIRSLGFSADSSLVSIWTRRADGSQPGDVSILAAPIVGGPLRPYLREAGEYDWSRDGKRLVYHTTAPGDPLFVREPGNLGDGGDRRIYVASAGVHCHFPLWSRDDAFIYFVRGVPPDDWDIWRIQPSGAGLERITNHNARVTYPVMLDRRTLVYLATDAGGSGPWIYVVDVERRLPHRISFGLESYTSLAASADGKRLVATTANSRASLWRLPLVEDRAAADGPTLVAANALTPRLAADLLLYVAWRGERQGIWALTHGTTREIWSSAHSRIVGGPAMTPDGRYTVFSVDDRGRSLLYLMDSDGSHLKILADSLALRGNPAWAPDGQSIVSAAVRDGEPRLMRIFLNGDSPLPLVSEYSTDPVWSPDGRFLVYSGADVGTTFPLRAAAADGRPYPLPSVMLTRGARRVAFFHGSETLVILGGEIGHKNFSLLDLRTGARRILADLPADFVIRDFDISADGSQIVFGREQVSSDLALIERMH